MNLGVALVIGDEHTLSHDQEESLADAGIAVSHAPDVPQAPQAQRPGGFDVVLADLPVSYPDAADRVDRLHTLAIEVPLILLAHEGHLSDVYEMAGEAVFDCLPRSVTGTWLTHKVHQALEQTRWKRSAGGVLVAGAETAVLAGVKNSATFAGRGPASERVRREISEAARSNMPIMIHGETGTGKDVVARLIHEAMRASRPGAFVKVSCPAFPEAMLEDELFGHAASPADERRARPGRLALASRGTLLLDEISEMSPSAQARLLEVLEPDSPGAEGWDLRLIAATSLLHERLYTSGSFRRDLYFRLNGYTIELPPLRERPEDIAVLAEFFLAKYAPLTGGRIVTLPPHALGRMTQYGWPGNVRELEVSIKRYVVSGDEKALTSTFVNAEQPLDDTGGGDRYHESERRVILAALSETRWNRRKAARILGISYNTLRRRIERYHLDTRAAN